jgi:hypothetical protein
MVKTIQNLAMAYNQSIDWTIRTANQYGGYKNGYQSFSDALDTEPDSTQCNHLFSILAALQVGPALNVNYNQWRASKVGNGRPRALRTGDFGIAGTDFFVGGGTVSQ